jgi:uncharacterized protein DUF4124
MRKTSTIGRKSSYLLVCCLSLCSQYAIAAMYKWVDDEGNTHYTQSPPPGDIEKEIIKPPPGIDSELSQKQQEDRKERLDKARDSRLDASEQARAEEEEKEKQRADCEKARAKLASNQRPRLNLKDKDGNVIRATEEQRQKEIGRAKELIKEFCN